MANYTETKQYQTEVVDPNKTIQLKTITITKKDGVVIGTQNTRTSFEPGAIDTSDNYTKTDLSGQTSDVQAIANAVWSQAVHDAWKAKLISVKDPSK